MQPDEGNVFVSKTGYRAIERSRGSSVGHPIGFRNSHAVADLRGLFVGSLHFERLLIEPDVTLTNYRPLASDFLRVGTL